MCPWRWLSVNPVQIKKVCRTFIYLCAQKVANCPPKMPLSGRQILKMSCDRTWGMQRWKCSRIIPAKPVDPHTLPFLVSFESAAHRKSFNIDETVTFLKADGEITHGKCQCFPFLKFIWKMFQIRSDLFRVFCCQRRGRGGLDPSKPDGNSS